MSSFCLVCLRMFLTLQWNVSVVQIGAVSSQKCSVCISVWLCVCVCVRVGGGFKVTPTCQVTVKCNWCFIHYFFHPAVEISVKGARWGKTVWGVISGFISCQILQPPLNYKLFCANLPVNKNKVHTCSHAAAFPSTVKRHKRREMSVHQGYSETAKWNVGDEVPTSKLQIEFCVCVPSWVYLSLCRGLQNNK